MSLKRHIEDSKRPLSKFLRSQFPNHRSFLATARKKVREATIIRQSQAVPWDIVGTALDYRMRYYFAVTSHEQLVAYKGARYLTGPQSQLMFMESDFRWSGSGNNRIEIAQEEGDVDSLKPEFRDLFDSLNRITQENSPIGTRLAQLREDKLNRHCIVLAFLEQASRTHRIDGVLNASRFSDARALLSIAESHWIDDLRELSWLFFDKYGDLSSLPFVLNPTFQGSSYVGGADADLIVDGTLIEIKCTIKNEIQPNWLMQVIAYVLLDFSDKYRISGIGIYMARHGLLFQWDLDELLAELCPGETPSTAYLRE